MAAFSLANWASRCLLWIEVWWACWAAFLRALSSRFLSLDSLILLSASLLAYLYLTTSIS